VSAGEGWHLSRVTLKRDAAVRAIAPVLLPDDDDDRISASHRLVWSLFAGEPDRRRDFLWHEEEQGRFLVFSPQPPDTRSPLFDVETRIFAQWPQTGERLAFFLRANPTTSQATQALNKHGKRKGGTRHDVIMQALHEIPGRVSTGAPLRPGEGRAHTRETLLGRLPSGHDTDMRRPVHDWLSSQGAVAGFTVERLRIDAYRRVRLPRSGQHAGHALVFGQADMEGELTVTDPAAFALRLKAGFGRSKAFGCGLMLLARTNDATGGRPA
jgi:CRISPR system Cascade subunit CasE